MALFKLNVERTLNAFTAGTYEVHEALYEFVDNSEVANAKKVVISAEPGGKRSPIERLIISDDGQGMNAEELSNALEFAGEIRKRDNHEISEYGVGMKAAAFSLALYFTIITKNCNGKLSGAFLDRERINKEQQYEGPGDKPTRNYEELWEKYAVESSKPGTIIVLEKLLQRTYKDCASFIGTPKSGIRHRDRLATRYRSIIDSERLQIFTVNGTGKLTILESFDPLRRNESNTQVVYDQSMFFEKEKVKFNFTLTRIDPNSTTTDFGIYIKVAGIVICKDSDTLLGMYKAGSSHSWHWRLRGEIDFADKEEFFKIMSFTSHKHSVQLTSAIFGDLLRDTDVGRVFQTESQTRRLESESETALRGMEKFEEEDSKFVEALNSRRELYGKCHSLLKYFGTLKGLKSGLFATRREVAKLQDGMIVYNMTNPQIAALLSDKSPTCFVKHQCARALATLFALQSENKTEGITFDEYHSFMSNLLALKT